MADLNLTNPVTYIVRMTPNPGTRSLNSSCCLGIIGLQYPKLGCDDESQPDQPHDLRRLYVPGTRNPETRKRRILNLRTVPSATVLYLRTTNSQKCGATPRRARLSGLYIVVSLNARLESYEEEDPETRNPKTRYTKRTRNLGVMADLILDLRRSNHDECLW
jgi:hypothetical protein